MAHEILSVKLCELDERICRMHSRIHFSESARQSQLKQEIAALERECAEEEMTLRNKLQFSKAVSVSILSQTYEEIEGCIRRAKDCMQATAQHSDDEMAAEEQHLLAEYVLDFAMQAANQALLYAMKAIDAQLTQDVEPSCGKESL